VTAAVCWAGSLRIDAARAATASVGRSNRCRLRRRDSTRRLWERHLTSAPWI
jgi:hypothetical protein